MSHTDQVKLEGVTEAASPILEQGSYCGDTCWMLNMAQLQDPSSNHAGVDRYVLFPDDIARLKAILAAVEV